MTFDSWYLKWCGCHSWYKHFRGRTLLILYWTPAKLNDVWEFLPRIPVENPSSELWQNKLFQRHVFSASQFVYRLVDFNGRICHDMTHYTGKHSNVPEHFGVDPKQWKNMCVLEWSRLRDRAHRVCGRIQTDLVAHYKRGILEARIFFAIDVDGVIMLIARYAAGDLPFSIAESPLLQPAVVLTVATDK